VQLILADPEVRNVLVSYRLNSYLFGDHDSVFPALPDGGSDGEREQIWQSYVGLLEQLVSAGKSVVLVLQAPELRGNVVQLIFSRRFAAENIEGVDREWWNRRTAFQRARMNEIPSQVMVIDPSELFCDQKSCAAVRDGVALYFDDNHMSVSGARIVAAEALSRQKAM
jgi:hypothetical protein